MPSSLSLGQRRAEGPVFSKEMLPGEERQAQRCVASCGTLVAGAWLIEDF